MITIRALFISFCLLPIVVMGQADSLQTVKAPRIGVDFQLGVNSKKNEADKNEYLPTIGALVAYRWKNILQPGVGLAYDYYEPFSALPVMLSITGELSQRHLRPFYYLQGGRSIMLAHDDDRFRQSDSGVVLAAGFGYRYHSDNLSLGLSFGWKRQVVTTYDQYYDYWYYSRIAPQDGNYRKTTWDLQRLEFKLWVGI